MSIVVIGLEHTAAPFDLLEGVVVADADLGKVLAAISAHDNVHEVVVVSTCLRTEIYAVVDRFHDAVDDFTEFLAARAGGAANQVSEAQVVFFDRGAATHLFKVASGLESAVPGESEVLGQVRKSLERASQEGTVGPTLAALFTHAISTGRKVRVETGIARGTTSFSNAAIQLAEAHLEGDLVGARVVVLGAGSLGTGSLHALIDERRGQQPGEVVLINRTREHAEELAANVSSSVTVRVADLESLADEIAGARLVISTIETDEPLVEASHVGGRRDQPVLILDLGMPRSVEHSVGEIEGVDLLDISDLRSAVQQAIDERRSEIDAAEAIIADEVARYQENIRGRGAAPIVVALRERLEELRRAEVERRDHQLAELTPEQRDAVEALTRSLVAKVAHEPTMALKESVGTPRGERLVEAARLLFDL
jgi:glutamyl-tRNA reductase